MLVLSRKKSESIEIGKNVRVRILEIRGGRVKLGVEAPRQVDVRRGDWPCECSDGCSYA